MLGHISGVKAEFFIRFGWRKGLIFLVTLLIWLEAMMIDFPDGETSPSKADLGFIKVIFYFIEFTLWLFLHYLCHDHSIKYYKLKMWIEPKWYFMYGSLRCRWAKKTTPWFKWTVDLGIAERRKGKNTIFKVFLNEALQFKIFYVISTFIKPSWDALIFCYP